MLKIIGLVCEGETVGKIGEVDEMGERENLCLWSVPSAAKMRHDTWMTTNLKHKDVQS